MNNLGLHVIKYPSGKYGYVGSVPAELAYVTTAGSTPSPRVLEEVRQSSNPSWAMKQLGIKATCFESFEEAVNFAREKGHSIVWPVCTECGHSKSDHNSAPIRGAVGACTCGCLGYKV